MAVVIGGALTLADTGNFAAEGSFLSGDSDHVQVSGAEYGFDFPSSAGVAGAGSKKFGFRNQRLKFKAYLVRAAASNIISDWNTYAFGTMVGPITITVHGTEFTRCFIDGKASFVDQIKETGLGKVFAMAVFVFDAKDA